MPELPEVETIKRDLQKLKGLTLGSVEILLPKIVSPSPAVLRRVLKSATVRYVRRRAKILAIDFRVLEPWNGTRAVSVLIHLKMTGQLVLQRKLKLFFGGHPIVGATKVPNKYTHVIFHFKNGDTLYFNDLRRFGYVKMVPTEEAERMFLLLGIEPLSLAFTLEAFEKVLAKKKKATVKAALLEQRGVAGIGNIYVDEACWRALIRPGRRVGKLTKSEKKKLWLAIRAVLTLSIRHRGTSFNTYVDTDGATGAFWKYRQAYGRKGLACRRCGTLILKTVVAQRGTHYCPKCQK